MAIKLHFTNDEFNVFENRGRVKGTRDTFNARNDRYIFEKLATKYPTDKEIIQFFVSNFAYNADTAIYEGKEAEDNLVVWTKRKQSITQVFIDDLATIITHIETNRDNSPLFFFDHGEYPLILKLYIGGKITIETVKIIDDIHPMVETWSNHPIAKFMHGAEFLRIKKLTGFIKYDRIKLHDIFKHFLEEVTS